ncbi:T7SS effector LXG polymorphic toxin [Bacillus paralicheniformis]|uniref:T7SS effector LXG polymorphic toxin n=2 Tax=Bacillus paralicheniformis TaxID=1648923 RepID=UPI002E23498F|nr:T7SS effector LXG polymorphic toxin [Bacillus paralicheniformis]
MKTLDVQALQNAIDQTLEQLKHQSEEFAKVKKAVDGITSLDDALKGKGGDAIRAFYKECHTPFLQFYDTFIEEYRSALKKMKSALNSLEPNHNGFISQSFLEHELENGLNAADRTTKHLVSKTNATIAKVSHIVDLPDLNDSGFHEQNQKAIKEISTTLEKLHAFDREQTNALKTAENDLETMQRYMARLEKIYTGPKIEITGYQKGAILKPDDNTKANGLPGGLQGQLENAEPSPMEMMLEKLNKNKRSNVYTVMRADNKENINQDVYTNDFDLNTLQKEAEKHPKVYGDIRVIDGKLYNHKGWKKVKTVDVADEVVQNPSDIKYIGGRYHVYENGQIVREYIVNGKVEMEAVKRIPESRSQGNLKRDFEGTPLEPVNDIGDFVAKEIAGGNDAVRVITGRDPDTGEKVSDVERAASGTSLTPVGRLLKYGRKGFKFFKGEETAKKVAKVEKSSKGSVKPVSNMNEFFDMEFGKSISNSLSKSKVKYDGQSIYKVEKKTDNPYLKKGYGVYLDALHKDHLEVIDKTGNVKYVLNLDGALNSDKTKKALGRVVKGWK